MASSRDNPETSEGSAGKWCALFVGGDPLWFGHLQRDVACLQPDWVCLHAPDSTGALRILAGGAVGAMVVDGQAGDARRLIEAVREEMPQINCLIRCDISDRKGMDSWKGLDVALVDSHRDASGLVTSLQRIVRLREWSSDPAIKALLPRIRKLPATPKLYLEVTEELRNSKGSLEVIARLIQRDPVMSAKLLQLVNSAFFASAREIADMQDAVMILGSERIKSLILLAGIFSQYHSSSERFALSVQAILAHSIEVGGFSRAIALSETQDAATAEAAFTAGVLHDVGKLILAGNLPEMFDKVQKLRKEEKLPEGEAELQVYGVSHTKVGACLLAAWGLPLAILEAIAYHDEPELSSGKAFSLLAAVHVANVFAHEAEPSSPVAGGVVRAGVNLQYLERVGLGDCRGRWREVCGVGAVSRRQR